MSSVYVVSTPDLPRAHVGGVDDPTVRWAGAFASYDDDVAIGKVEHGLSQFQCGQGKQRHD